MWWKVPGAEGKSNASSLVVVRTNLGVNYTLLETKMETQTGPYKGYISSKRGLSEFHVILGECRYLGLHVAESCRSLLQEMQVRLVADSTPL